MPSLLSRHWTTLPVGATPSTPWAAPTRWRPPASLLVTAGHLTLEEAYAAVSSGARAAMGLPEVQVAPGFPAELLAVEASSLGEAIAGGTSRVVVHQGRVVSRTTITREVLVPTAATLAATARRSEL